MLKLNNSTLLINFKGGRIICLKTQGLSETFAQRVKIKIFMTLHFNYICKTKFNLKSEIIVSILFFRGLNLSAAKLVNDMNAVLASKPKE